MSMIDPAPVLDLIQAFRRSKTMFTAVSLGVFDRLGDGTAASAQLASQLDAHPIALEQLMDACAGLGLLEKQDGAYRNSLVTQKYLRRDSPDTLTGYILYSNEALYPMWADLEGAVREGSPRWGKVFGLHGGLFSSFYRTPEARETFLRGMHGLGRLTSPELVRVFNLVRFQRIVDLGGGTGHLAIAACERCCSMEGIVFDLAEAVEHARPHVEASPARDRVRLVAGDFFQDALPAADLYALGRILHDWNDDRIRELLRRIHAALPSGGALLIAESLLDDDKTGPIPAQMQSLNMLVCTEGRERSEAEYRALLEGCGFVRVEARRTGVPLDALLAHRD
jgi:acetylserotonin O-methyltransferase